ncbi:hypothetical protein BSAE_1858 [Bifidobacterium pullorum subsp. saeculare DSM 6531 = LMG 14934]|uniref:Uncharacterized protein n=1 Tax=Bifidobacterium pullorum subsp. saeculare DSM 6531 = LMG 14934 TaxID=1437611 RepID=A0A087CPF6_9BIFI|nr:hypothetical protein BSAE_1858 [Bifidobacterium pullorum subsp. saeculare DSM 6531 = LMG 14934]
MSFFELLPPISLCFVISLAVMQPVYGNSPSPLTKCFWKELFIQVVKSASFCSFSSLLGSCVKKRVV